MSSKALTAEALDAMVERVLSSRKYAEAQIPAETIRDLLSHELAVCKSAKEAEKAMREKLHQIMAPYLGDPDYAAEEAALRELVGAGQDALNKWCLKILSVHSSSRERIPVMEAFYRRIFEFTGKPRSILDLACAFDPFSFPWMGLETDVTYRAYDLHTQRVHLINSYFMLQGLQPLAEVRDILLDPPRETADVAFFFKEAHRFESRQRGCNRKFWQSLPVEWIVVTLPAENLTGQHTMRARQQSLIEKNIEGLDWTVREFEVAGEMVFLIRKNG